MDVFLSRRRRERFPAQGGCRVALCGALQTGIHQAPGLSVAVAALLARSCLMFIVHSCVTLIEYFIVFPVVLKPIIHYPAQPVSASPLIDDTRQNAWSNIPVSPPQLGLAPCHPRPCQSSSAPVGDLEDKGDTATGSSGPPWCSSQGPGAEAAGLAEGTGCPWAGT